MLEFTAAQLGGWLGSFFWPFFRVMGFFATVPIIGTQLVPSRVRLLLALAVTIVIVPVLPAMPQVEGLSLQSIAIILQQVLIGSALGFFLQLLFQIFILGGQMIAMQMGLGFASMLDPANGISVAILSSFYLMAVTLLFVVMNGHLVVIEIMVQSFYSIPVQYGSFDASLLWIISNTISWVFSSALLLALPALTALLITNFAFGIMTRAAPQLNIFSLGFPVALMFGLIIAWITMEGLSGFAGGLFNQAFINMRDLVAQ